MTFSQISIHAPRTGSDHPRYALGYARPDFNPRSPHGERPSAAQTHRLCTVFQSTLPARGATRQEARRSGAPHYFNPRSPHGERPLRRVSSARSRSFQSTLPARGATRARPCKSATRQHFNPRSPHGERPAHPLRATGWQHFNPRSPHGERQEESHVQHHRFRISIHAPRTGSDDIPLAIGIYHSIFQSTLPARGATAGAGHTSAPRIYFNPRSPHGERQAGEDRNAVGGNFNPRSPHGERLVVPAPLK